MTVPEGYIGNEAPVCFVLTNRSSQICVPEPLLSGFGAGSLTHAGEGEACDIALGTFSCQL